MRLAPSRGAEHTVDAAALPLGNAKNARRLGRARGSTIRWRFVILGTLFGFAVLELFYFTFRSGGLWEKGLFSDGNIYMAQAQAWLAGHSFYPAAQLAGPYEIRAHEILYPPSALAILVPFSFLPVAAFVAVPVAITAYVVWWQRPSFWAWVVISLLVAYPWTLGGPLFANPGLWAVTFCAAATRWPAAGPWVMVKPSLFPFALAGVRHRAWWLSAALCMALVIVTLPMWLDWLTVLQNARGPLASLGYSVHSVPSMLVPVVAALGSTRPSR